MSILDKVVAAVTPLESQEERVKARSQARAAASTGDWLSQVLDHHQLLEQAFADVKVSNTPSARKAALKHLAILLTGHAIAEEAILYPAMTRAHDAGHAEMAYQEQVAAKIQMAALETLNPMSQEFLDKLEHVRGAVTHHMYEEESKWFPELKDKLNSAQQQQLSDRYNEEFNRYVRADVVH